MKVSIDDDVRRILKDKKVSEIINRTLNPDTRLLYIMFATSNMVYKKVKILGDKGIINIIAVKYQKDMIIFSPYILAENTNIDEIKEITKYDLWCENNKDELSEDEYYREEGIINNKLYFCAIRK